MKLENINDYIEFSNQRLTKRVIFKEGKTTGFILNFQPGQVLPAHKHPGANLQLLLLQGTGIFTIDGEQYSVKKDDVLYVNGDEEVSFTNNGESNVSIYVMLNNIPNDQYAKNF